MSGQPVFATDVAKTGWTRYGIAVFQIPRPWVAT